jgi:hypothetical protein
MCERESQIREEFVRLEAVHSCGLKSKIGIWRMEHTRRCG